MPIDPESLTLPITHELLFIKRNHQFMLMLRYIDRYLLMYRSNRRPLTEARRKEILKRTPEQLAKTYENLRTTNINQTSWPPATKAEIIKSHYLAFPHIKPENPDV